MGSRPFAGRRIPSVRALTPPIELLETRALLSLSFAASTPTAPAVNRADLALGTISSSSPIEPMVQVSSFDPGTVAASSHRGIRISSNGGATFGSAVTFPSPAGTNSFAGDTDFAFDRQGRIYWSNLAGVTNLDISVARLSATGAVELSNVVQVDTNTSDVKAFITTDNYPAS